MTMEKGVPIRAITRGLSVLQAINRGGSITMMEIARTSRVPYPTACRIVQTLLHEGMIEREPARKRYRATALVQSLASGFHDDSRLVAIARPHIDTLCDRLLWPISITSRVGAHMMVRDSTHTKTSLTLNNYYPGFTLPIMECSSGKAYMAFCSDAEREHLIEGLRTIEGAAERMATLLLSNDSLLKEIRRNSVFMSSVDLAGEASFGDSLTDAVGEKLGSIAYEKLFTSGLSRRDENEANHEGAEDLLKAGGSGHRASSYG